MKVVLIDGCRAGEVYELPDHSPCFVVPVPREAEYVLDPSTRPLLLSWAIDDDPIKLWCPDISDELAPEVWAYDPDAIKIQLQHVSYGHGAGPLGAALPPARPKSTSAFNLKSISHVTLTNSNGSKSLDFYSRMFGWPVQSKQGPTQWCFSVGEGLDCVVFNVGVNNPAAKTGVNHACFTMPAFDANTVMNILSDNGLEPIEYGNAALIKPLTCRTRLRQRANNGGGPGHWLGTPELYFNDPDNIAMQLQDVSYCGGSGMQGEVCP